MSKIYTRVKPAQSITRIHSFPAYEEALAFSRSIEGHKPRRHVEADNSVRWHVITPNLDAAPAEFIKQELPGISDIDAEVLALVMKNLPDIASVASEPVETFKQPDSHLGIADTLAASVAPFKRHPEPVRNEHDNGLLQANSLEQGRAASNIRPFRARLDGPMQAAFKRSRA